MITVYDNKQLPGHLTLLCQGDRLVGHPPYVSRLNLTIDDFETIPVASFVLIFDAGTAYLHDEHAYMIALVTNCHGVFCRRFSKSIFLNNSKITNDKHL
jgi:hypothetical protein